MGVLRVLSRRGDDRITWNEQKRELTIAPGAPKGSENEMKQRTFTVQLVPGNEIRTVIYSGKSLKIKF